MLSIFLFLSALLLPGVNIAEANSGMAGRLAPLQKIEERESEAIFDYDEEYMGEDEDEAFEFTPAQPHPAPDGANYCVGTFDDIYLWQVKAKKKSRCACSSGCGMIQKGLKPTIKKYVEAAKKIGIHPVSCIRTQACQDRLRSCYERCGQRGRAAKKSKHADGKACDFSKKHGSRLTQLKRSTGLPIKRLTHGKEGGGLHEYE